MITIFIYQGSSKIQRQTDINPPITVRSFYMLFRSGTFVRLTDSVEKHSNNVNSLNSSTENTAEKNICKSVNYIHYKTINSKVANSIIVIIIINNNY